MDRAKAVFLDSNTKQYVTYEVFYKSVGQEVADDVIAGFEALTGHYSRRSRDQAWRSIRKFCKFLQFIDFGRERIVDDIVVGFGEFLEKSWPQNKANFAYYNFTKRLVKWLAEETEKPVWKDHDQEPVRFLRKPKAVQGNILSATVLRLIVEACKREIAQIKKDFSVRLRIEAGEIAQIDQLIGSKALWVEQVIRFEADNIWSKEELVDAGCPLELGNGLRELAGYKELTQKACLPIFLLLMIQTAANPYALMEINRDCVEANPLDDESVILRWKKGRASKVQQFATMKKGNYSVFNLVKLVIKMTKPIRKIALQADKDFLFITRHGNLAKRLNGSGLHSHLAAFRERNNLDFFTFRDVRRVIAETVYTQTSSIEAASKILQHRNLSTTEIYLKGDVVKQQRYGNLAKFQGMMLAMIDQRSTNEHPHYDTAFGFRCASPLAGSVGRSKKGEPCIEFLMCAGCRNAIIAVDDAQVIARVIRARDSISRMEKSSHLDQGQRIRYTEVFQPILDIIERDILSAVSKSTIKHAEKLATGLCDLPVIY